MIFLWQLNLVACKIDQPYDVLESVLIFSANY
jgi:hypothetical protein